MSVSSHRTKPRISVPAIPVSSDGDVALEPLVA
jgi:hypothetical protein